MHVEVALKFSELFNISDPSSESWFDVILNLDTKLFVDPFLIYAAEHNEFTGSHKEVIDFFNVVFSLIAKSGGKNGSPYWKQAQGLLVFPEVEELCLGYTGIGTKGSGSGAGFSKLISEAIWQSIQVGVKEITHFEEISLLKEGIGADRISDITATILKHRFIDYTNNICKKHNIPLFPNRMNGRFDSNVNRWLPILALLPRNPHNNKSILLSPSNYLRDLPTINADSFWGYCRSNENDLLRSEFGFDIQSKVNKHDIVKFAKKHSECRERFMRHVEEENPNPYDMAEDRNGFVKWYDATKNYVHDNQLNKSVNSNNEFHIAIKTMLDEFKKYVEDNRGWELLWNDDGTPKREHASQTLLQGIVSHYCKANDIDINREPNIGRGPVDFKVSRGYQLRMMLELKLAKNSKFWNGLSKQLPKYLEADGVEVGYFIIILCKDNEFKKLSKLRETIKGLRSSLPYEITEIIIDARRNPPSASKLY